MPVPDHCNVTSTPTGAIDRARCVTGLIEADNIARDSAVTAMGANNMMSRHNARMSDFIFRAFRHPPAGHRRMLRV
jgi:hypothetical protein